MIKPRRAIGPIPVEHGKIFKTFALLEILTIAYLVGHALGMIIAIVYGV